MPKTIRLMTDKTRSMLLAAWRCIVPCALSAGDQNLLRWAILCAIVLTGTGLFMLTGGAAAVGEWQVELLLGRPFYMEAQDVQISLLSPGAAYAICVGLTLYFSLLLPRLNNAAARTQICFLTGIALLLPGCIGTLWHGVLYVAPFLFCLTLLWLLTFIPYFRPQVNKRLQVS